MYGKLWNFVNQYIDKEHALAVYLPILIVGWTIIGTVLGMGVCSVIRINLVQSLSDIICVGGYAGIILGLFGGILYLYRKYRFDVEIVLLIYGRKLKILF